MLGYESDIRATGGDGGGRQRPLQGVVRDRIDVEELHRLERAPDLLPATAVAGHIEDVDQRPLKRGHA